MKKQKHTYISLFSSAGVGCYGFLSENFKCVATNDINIKRMNIQKLNQKCKYESGYILGDIRQPEIKQSIFSEINRWQIQESMNEIDIVVATPPCQGMSVANHKKNDLDHAKNSLVIEAINLIDEIQPRFFIFENVASFLKTLCTDIDQIDKTIESAIFQRLSKHYEIYADVINFKNYGSNSSRTRTLVIGTHKAKCPQISPLEILPNYQAEKTLKDIIYDLPRLKNMGEIDPTDIYHYFREYDLKMLPWIENTPYGESAFNNKNIQNQPHKIIDDQIILNANKNGNKYQRQIWEKVAPCVHTRNDILASQNTVHPEDNRVFSIRELMLMMTIPDSFQWAEGQQNINQASLDEKKAFLKKHDCLIRQSIGEAVPTAIYQQIASKIKQLDQKSSNKIKIFENQQDLVDYLDHNPDHLSYAELTKIIEYNNPNRENNAAYYTDNFLIYKIINNLPDIKKSEIRILEPSVGGGAFIPYLISRFKSYKQVNITVNDIDPQILNYLKRIQKYLYLPDNIKISYENQNFLEIQEQYDYVIGNPPFIKNHGYQYNCMFSYCKSLTYLFVEHALKIGKITSLILPKSFLGNSECLEFRNYLSQNYSIHHIIDFGEYGFHGVKIETISICIQQKFNKNQMVKVISIPQKIEINQLQSYICDLNYPSWIIYRNQFFDETSQSLKFNQFDVFRDRQITKSILKTSAENSNDIRVLSARNIKSLTIDESIQKYISHDILKNKAVYKYLNESNLILVPNMTYYPRACFKPKNIICDGSVAILIPRENIQLNEKDIEYFSTSEFEQFYKIVRNFATRTLNVDNIYVYYFGLKN